MPTLGLADYAVIAVTLLISSTIGVYYWLTGGRQKSTEEYFVADRSMRVAPVAIGLMVSYLSAVSLLGVSSENYVYGTQYAVINISYGLATPVVVYFYLPVFFKLGATSAFEYLQRRFGRATRLAASLAFLLQLLLYSGVVLYAPALALEATTGISTSASVIGIGLVCTFYSTIGGIKAVLVTDVFQSGLMLVAVLLVIAAAALEVGGLAAVWEIARQGGRIEFDNLSPDPTARHTWWSLTIGGFFTYLSLYGTNQVQVQRMLTVKDLSAAQRALWWSWPLASIMSLGLCFSGLAIYTRYRSCDPVEAGRIATNDQLMPLYVMDALAAYQGVPGLFIAGIFSAGLSTVSATINSLAAVVLEDYARPLVVRASGKELSATQSIVASKVLAVLVGLACIGVAFLARYLGGVLQAALTIFGVVGGPVMGLFTLGMFTESRGQRGAIAGLLISLVFSLWIGFGQPKPPIPRLPVSTAGCNLTVGEPDRAAFLSEVEQPASYFYLYRLSYMWYCPLGCVIALLAGWLVNRLLEICGFDEGAAGGKREEVHPDLLAPVIARRVRRARENRDEFRGASAPGDDRS